jgi:predicted GNAT family acetyltransferase
MFQNSKKTFFEKKIKKIEVNHAYVTKTVKRRGLNTYMLQKKINQVQQH